MITLYQLNYEGTKLNTWTIDYKPNGEYFDIITTSQLEGGKLSSNTSVVKVLKQGYKNLEEQVKYSVDSKVNEKLKDGWVCVKEDAKSSIYIQNGAKRPMLANILDPHKKKGGSKTLVEFGLIGKRVALQPKLDGNRLETTVNSGSYLMHSREGEIMDFPHLGKALTDVFKRLSNSLAFSEDNLYCLDGEIYNHAMEFDAINGTYRKFKDVDADKQRKLQYHIYDIDLPLGFKDRYKFLQNIFYSVIDSEYIDKFHLVETVFIDECTQEIVDEYLEKWTSQGYEGLMIRQLGMSYEHKRTNQLIKYKPGRAEDEEFVCIGYKESAYGYMIGSLIFDLGDGSGRTFKGTPNIPEERNVEWWNNRESLIGKKFTVVFDGKTQYGIPRFPKVKAERN